MGPALAIGSAVAPIITGFLGDRASKGARDAANRAMEAAMAEIDAVGAPPDLSREIILEKLAQVGILSPELEQNINVGLSQLAQYQEDEANRNALTSGLQLLMRASQEGLGPQEYADLNRIRSQAAQAARGKEQQILQNMQSRGIAGSGAELAAQLSNTQASDEMLSQQGLDIAAQSQRRALEALGQGMNVASGIRSGDLSYAQTTGSAADEFRKFDVANQVGVQQRNVGSLNRASEQNLAEKQRISDANAQQANQEKYRQAEAQRQFWQDKLAYAQAKAGAQQSQAANYNANADRIANKYAGIGTGIAGGMGQVGQAMNQSDFNKLYADRTNKMGSPTYRTGTAEDARNLIDYDDKQRRKVEYIS